MQATKGPTRPRLIQAMIDAFRLPDLRKRILITFGIIVLSRFIAHIPLPGVDTTALHNLFQNNALLGMLDMFSGGAMRNFSVAAMGVYPYITASIVIQLLIPVIPYLQNLSQEGEAGQARMNRITHWLTVPMAGLSGWGQLALLQRAGIVGSTTPLATVSMIMALIAGTIFLVWLGELITEYGIGNGVSIIIFAGIVAGYPQLVQSGLLSGSAVSGTIAYGLISIATVVAIVIFTEAHRRVPVQYAKTVFRGGRMYRQSGATHIPLRVNAAGMIPLIFAMSIVLFPGVIASYFQPAVGQPANAATWIVNNLTPNALGPIAGIYWGSYFLLCIGFTFFYTWVIFQQQDLPGTLQKQGGFVPGVRPGKHTADFFNHVINRITWAGALYLGIIAVMPFLAREITNVQAIQLSSTGLLIVVGVVLDTMKQMEAQLVMRRYEGFIK